jgi:hypothetical protein
MGSSFLSVGLTLAVAGVGSWYPWFRYGWVGWAGGDGAVVGRPGGVLDDAAEDVAAPCPLPLPDPLPVPLLGCVADFPLLGCVADFPLLGCVADFPLLGCVADFPLLDPWDSGCAAAGSDAQYAAMPSLPPARRASDRATADAGLTG